MPFRRVRLLLLPTVECRSVSRLAIAIAFVTVLLCPRMASAANVTLAWDPPVDGVTTGYVLSIGTSSRIFSTEIDVRAFTSYMVTGLSVGTTYYFSVRARNAMGVLSDPSGEVSTTPQVPPGTVRPSGDFKRDDVRDLLFHGTSGHLYVWMMNGLSFASGAWLSPAVLDPAWRVVGARDFTGDGHPDLVVQHAKTGVTEIQKMVGLDRVGAQRIFSPQSTVWTVAAIGDFNGDAEADLVWENSATGEIYFWFMAPAAGDAGFAGADGAFSGGYLRDAQQRIVSLGPTTRRVVGAADMDRDGEVDLVWQDGATNEVGAWLIRGVTKKAEVPLRPHAVAPAWRVRVVGDYTGDGWPDLLWQHATTGALYMWELVDRVLVFGSHLTPSSVNPVWRLVGP